MVGVELLCVDGFDVVDCCDDWCERFDDVDLGCGD